VNRIGTLDELLTPATPSTTYAAAVPTTTWTDGTAFWARVDEGPAGKSLRAGQVDAAQPVTVTARFVDVASLPVTARLRRADGRVLEIESAREIGRREGREFLCSYNADGGV